MYLDLVIMFCELSWWLGGKKICLPMQETRVRSLDLAGPLEKKMATHPSILAWETPQTEEPGGLPSWGHKELDAT